MKPILFNTEMVKAILEGRKTVTRRVIKPPNPFRSDNYKQGRYGLWIDETTDNGDKCGHIKDYSVSPCWQTFSYYIKNCAPYKVGDVLYVHESAKITGYGGGDKGYYVDCQFCDDTKERFYVPFDEYKRIMNKCVMMWNGDDPYKHPKFSPYWLTKHESRIFLRVTDVRVERLQDMTEDDVCSEGAENLINFCEHMDYSVVPPEPCYNTCNVCKDCIIDHSYPKLFGRQIWDPTIKKNDLDRYGWEANPWVWVIEFARMQKAEINE